MELIKLKECIELNGGYAKEGKQLSNFVVAAEKIIMPDKISLEFCLEIKCGAKVYPLRKTLGEITGRKFLRNVPVLLYDESGFYQRFRRALLETDFGAEDTFYLVNNPGLQEVNGRFVYVFSNGCIWENGFSPLVYSGMGRAYIPEKAVLNPALDKGAVRNSVCRLLAIFNCNPEVFYPLFFLNISAICNGYFRRLGEREFMKFTVWMDGKSGSGKTELAKAAGTFVFADKELNPNFVSATGKSKYIIDHVKNSSGSVCILDDVKTEKVRDRRNSVAAAVDDVLRSTYQGMLTDGSGQFIDTCSLITGEYMDTQESQNARLFYLKTDQFLKEGKNSSALRKLQEDPLLVTTVCCSFIQWFLRRIKENSFPQLLLQKIRTMRNQEKEYQGIANAERLNENIHMLRMAQEMAVMFFQDIALPEKFLRKFNVLAKNSIKLLGEDTYILLDGENMALLKVAENVLLKCKLRKAKFEEDGKADSLYRYRQEEFMIHEGEDFVYIEDMEKSLQLASDEGHDQFVSHPYLIGTESNVLDLFAGEIENMQQTGQISSVMAERLSRNLPMKLKKTQIIYKKIRSDSAWGRTAVKYPVCHYKPFNPHQRPELKVTAHFGTICMVGCEPAIQMNTAHPCMKVLYKRLEESKFIRELPTFMRSEYNCMSKEEIHDVRREFMNRKSLYKE